MSTEPSDLLYISQGIKKNPKEDDYVYFNHPSNKQVGIDVYTFPDPKIDSRETRLTYLQKEKLKFVIERCFKQSHPNMEIEVKKIRPQDEHEGLVLGYGILHLQAYRKDGKEITDEDLISLATTIEKIAEAIETLHTTKNKGIAE